MTELFTTGTGQTISVHSAEQCKGQSCVIHNPSPHSMRFFPTHWRADRAIMERICPHGVGHPDPDDAAFRQRSKEKLCDYEEKLLKELVTGESQGLSWGAAMSVTVEFLSEMGYVTRGPRYEPTQKGKDYIAGKSHEGVHGCDGCCAKKEMG